MNFLIDGLIIAIALTCCIWGYKNGFVKTVVNFFKNIFAIIIAAIFSSRVGALLYDFFFKGVFENMVVNKVSAWLGVDPSANIDIGPLIAEKHSEFFRFAEALGFDFNAITDKYNDVGSSAGELMVEYIAHPIAKTISNVLAFILIFVLAVLVIKLLGFILGKIAKLPVLNATNKLLGLILGAVLGIIFVFIFVAIVKALAPYMNINGNYFFNGELQESTIVYKYLSERNPIGLVQEILTKIGVI